MEKKLQIDTHCSIPCTEGISRKNKSNESDKSQEMAQKVTRNYDLPPEETKGAPMINVIGSGTCNLLWTPRRVIHCKEEWSKNFDQ